MTSVIDQNDLSTDPGAALDDSNAIAQSAGVRRRFDPKAAFGPWVVLGLFIALWYWASNSGLPKHKQFLLPDPGEVLDEAFLTWGATSTSGNSAKGFALLLEKLFVTAQVAFVGLVIAVLLGLVVGVLMAQVSWVEKSIWPYLIALQSVPILAIGPLIGNVMGFSFSARVVVTVMIAFFPIVSNTVFGMKAVEQSHRELFQLHHTRFFTRLFKLQFPSALPAIFAGLRISAGLAVIGAVVGDLVFGQGKTGLGRQIEVYRRLLRNEEMIAAIILCTLLGLIVFWFFGWLNKRAVGHWHEGSQGS
jgi:NitT/TauT family transport system permease protein